MNRIAVFCGSSAGIDPNFEQEAFRLGQLLAEKNIGVVYGGAKIGLMGAVAEGALDKGGEVIGVIPDFLQTKEVAHNDLSEMIVVESMHERKLKMHDLSDGFIALPGGFGTMEELFEILTWAQLGLHHKPIGLLNIKEFYQPLLTMIQGMNKQDFLKTINKDMLLQDTDMNNLLQKMESYKAPETPEWMKKSGT
ncbi:TIGR00730 family Rossman fold protein [Marivirga arenosa]|uniref:Cytokinin riboside 5'-monophosphate phosphoribohydrolase n=1 Tax=Marivirga arenosa TaxID=3059076 RepID=A0AA51RCN6_9BACT|nr:TIGR00730 family Rossman fold protein [Marivirga sp. ABR2-2]WMN05930.1 TIGR00730 family Rossman fold protein [Marivirga sp. ABR2-2]